MKSSFYLNQFHKISNNFYMLGKEYKQLLAGYSDLNDTANSSLSCVKYLKDYEITAFSTSQKTSQFINPFQDLGLDQKDVILNKILDTKKCFEDHDQVFVFQKCLWMAAFDQKFHQKSLIGENIFDSWQNCRKKNQISGVNHLDDFELVIMENLNEKLQKYEESKGVFDVLPAKGLHEYCGRRFESEERILCIHLGYVGPSNPKYPLEDYCSERVYTKD